MQNNRLGCLTGVGLFSAFITLVAIVGVAFASGAQMFTAGALNAQGSASIGGVNSHAQITECSACHAAPLSGKTMADRCMACHQNVVTQLSDSTSLHGMIAQKNPKLTCRACHPEHRGADAALTDLSKSQFSHNAFGFSLNGHQLNSSQKPFTCGDCHKNNTYAFALQTCDDCHRQIDSAFADKHALAFGAECLACHDGVDRYGSDFNHAAFFALDGKHATADCFECHANARSASDFKSASSCSSCHTEDDAHLGKFGEACGVCHSPDAWSPAKFNHDLADFKLEGRHVKTDCEKCHANNAYKGTPKDCYSCHQNDDEHNGAYGKNCETCHNASLWDNATFDHNTFAFKLEGKHADVECEKCHVNNVFKSTPTDCYSCHQNNDEHDGGFGTTCESCHNATSWDDAAFDHNLSAFKLDGAHAYARCETCHVNKVFKNTPANCDACHADPAFHAGAFGADCASCHHTSAWQPAGFNFSHPEPRVHEGGNGLRHGGATCKECHPTTVRQSDCSSCHRGGFEGGEGEDD